MVILRYVISLVVGEGSVEIEDQLASLVDDPEFQQIVHRRSTFNLFEAVGAVRGELRHSNFLRFLLDPRESHGLGSKPLERLLRAVLATIEPADRPVRSLELIVGDLDDAQVEREESNIDLLVRIGSLRLVVLIENKIGAKAGVGQLRRYREHVEKTFPQWRKFLIFLTPDGADPDDDGYVAFGYSKLAEVIEELLKEAVASETAIALRHYVEMLRRHIVPDQQLNQLALQLYNRHKSAFDFVIKNIPKDSLFEIAKQLVETSPEVVADAHGANIVRFVPKAWATVPQLNQCPKDKWSKTGRHLLFELKTFNTDGMRNRLLLALLVGPGPDKARASLYDAAKERGFIGLVKPMGAQYATIFAKELLSESYGATLDLDDKRSVAQTAWSAFVADDMPKLEREIFGIIGHVLENVTQPADA